jgi:hypothetical protein
MLLMAIGCSQSPTAPTPTATEPPTQPGPSVINLQWNVTAASCAPVATPPAQPAFSAATMVRNSETSITAAWPHQTGSRPTTLIANFIFENNVWGL